MKKFLSLFCSFFALSFTSPLIAEEINDPATGISFPLEVSFEENGQSYTLEATGVATRKKLFAKVYSIAHYMQNPIQGSPDTVIAEVLDNDSIAKQLTMHWVRKVSPQKIQSAYESALETTLTPNERAAMQDEIDTFIGFFQSNSEVGDVYIFRWLPEGKLIIEINEKRAGEINNPAFARAVWEIWLGSNRVVKRNNLVSLYTQ
ncbi:MAG: chalcone isomerase family protein [Chlamydiota bacterium]|nr:chalcone isomerase family protein [Chlamydiota bacterium]